MPEDRRSLVKHRKENSPGPPQPLTAVLRPGRAKMSQLYSRVSSADLGMSISRSTPGFSEHFIIVIKENKKEEETGFIAVSELC